MQTGSIIRRLLLPTLLAAYTTSLNVSADQKVVLGSFSDSANANTVISELEKSVPADLVIERSMSGPNIVYRVVTPAAQNEDQLKQWLSQIRIHVPGAWVISDAPNITYQIVLGSYNDLASAKAFLVRLPADLDASIDFRTPPPFRIVSGHFVSERIARDHLAALRTRYTDAWLMFTEDQRPIEERAVASGSGRAIQKTVAIKPTPSASTQTVSASTTRQPATTPPSPSQTTLVEKTNGVSTAKTTKSQTSKPTTVVISSDKTTGTPGSSSRPKSTFVPPGFENLLEPQTTEVDVYFGGVFIVSTFVTYTPSEITFLNASDIVDRLPDLLEPGTVLMALGEQLNTNAALACLSANQVNCGTVDADTVEVIFDENRFRVDVFLGRNMLAVRDSGIDKFLPASSGRLSLLHQINANFSGGEGESGIFNVGNATNIAFGETRLLALSNLTDSEDFTVDTLALEREFSGRLYQAGYFRANAGNGRFINEVDFAGVSLRSSLDTRADLDQSAGNSLQLFLEGRSRVDIFKDGRLVSSRIYETGNQVLDTSNLPGGAYDIELVIRDSFGRSSRETRFYTKTNDLPPMDQPLFFVDVGRVTARSMGDTLPATTQDNLFRAGYSRRLSQNFGGQVGISRQGKLNLAEAGLFHLGRFYDLNLSLAAGSADDRGANLTTRLRLGAITLNANARKTWLSSEPSLLNRELTQADLSVAMPTRVGTLSLTSRYNKSDTRADKNYGIRLNLPTYSKGRTALDTDFSLTEDNGELLALLGFRITFHQGRWRHNANGQYFNNESVNGRETGLINDIGTSWSDEDQFVSDLTWSLRAVDEQFDESIQSEFNFVSDRGRVNIDTDYSNNTGQLEYGASMATTFIANSDAVSFGGRSSARSALVMDIKGDVEDAYFDVLVNGSVRGSAQIGTKTVIGVQPFETYEVALLPKGDALVDFNDQVKTVTIYPGNVVTLKFEAVNVLVAFGQILKPDGSPLAGAVLEGVKGLAITDDFGLFQAEVESTLTSVSARTRTETCVALLPEIDSSNLVVALGELTCQ